MNLQKELKMTQEIGNNLPLMLVPVPKENALQKRPDADIISPEMEISVVPNRGTGSDSEPYCEKGTFIDIYI